MIAGDGLPSLNQQQPQDCDWGLFFASPNRNKVLGVELSGRPTERRLYSQILAAVDAPHSPRASIVDVERGALNILRDIGVQILVIDEIHNILAGSWREQRIVAQNATIVTNSRG